MALAILLLQLLAGACQAQVPASGADREAPTAAPGAWERALSDADAFGRVHERLSEAGGYFDTDNLISNEASYLHVIGDLERRGVRGGAYVGVGPDQNFAYIAAVRPRVAFIVDIRRDNVLQHLIFKALFEAAGSRLEYLCLLVGRACRAPRVAGETGTLAEIVDAVDAAGPDAAAADAARELVLERVDSYGIPLSDTDRASIAAFHDEFIRHGLDLRFRSHGRSPRPYYPTLRQLLLERDLEGRRRGYLASEESFRFVKSMSDRNLIIPVVGDLSGPHALAEIGRVLSEMGETLSVLYASNVEFYLWRQGRFGEFAANLESLPAHGRTALIRSYFGGGFRPPHPDQVPGYASAQLLDPLVEMLEAYRRGAIGSYRDLVLGRRTAETGTG